MTFSEKWEAAFKKQRDIPRPETKNVSRYELVKLLTVEFCYAAAKEIYDEQEKRIKAMRIRADKLEADLKRVSDTRL